MDQDYSSYNYSMPTWAIILICALVIIEYAGLWKTFVKAGQPGWACIIPIYNAYILLKIGGKPWWWLLLFLIPVVNIIYAIWMINMISKSFGNNEGFTVGLIILPVIFWPILGFGDAKYQGPFGNPEAFRAYREQHKFDFENKA
jgi:hypothetical protein